MKKERSPKPHTHDVVDDAPPSDPAYNVEEGHEWASEGGALAEGPATSLPERASGDENVAVHSAPQGRSHDEPGLDRDLIPKADHGERTYIGHGRLAGKRALITGADSGIGAAITIAFAREGATVCMAYLPGEEPDANRISSIIENAGRATGSAGEVGTIYRLPGNLLDPEYRHSLVDKAVGLMGGIDILVNNAGRQISVEHLADLTEDQIDETFDVNIKAMFTLSKHVLAHMNRGATIINTTSIQAYSPSGHLLDYATTKAAINAFTKGLAQQVGPKGIRVNAVAPGPIWTPLQPPPGQPPEALPHFGEDTWLGRAGQPAELAGAYVFLASNEASYITGATLHVNGGKVSP